MENRANPQPGERWVNHKDKSKIYRVLGTSGSKLIREYSPVLRGKHTDDARNVVIYIYENQEITLTEEDGITVIEVPHVIYISTYNDDVFARPLDEFMEYIPRFIQVT